MSNNLNAEERDFLLEMINIGVGRSASALSEMAQRQVEIEVPQIEVFDLTGDEIALPESVSGQILLRISQKFHGNARGVSMLIFNKAGAERIAELLLDSVHDGDALDENEQSALLEMGNIMIGNSLGCIADQFQMPIEYDIPYIQLRGTEGFVNLVSDLIEPGMNRLLMMQSSLTINQDQVSGYLIILMDEVTYGLVLQKVREFIR